jgi:hypothetical protein
MYCICQITIKEGAELGTALVSVSSEPPSVDHEKVDNQNSN